jgi:membrane protein YqaA with SNARE-associated domain
MFDPQNLIATFGYLGMFLTVFIETGLLVGFFLPGDSLLLAAGIFAATPGGPISIIPTILVFIAGSFLGDQLGYWVGRIAGPRVFNRPQSRFFDPENVVKAKSFFDKYGVLTIIVARFVPVVHGPECRGCNPLGNRRDLARVFSGPIDPRSREIHLCGGDRWHSRGGRAERVAFGACRSEALNLEHKFEVCGAHGAPRQSSHFEPDCPTPRGSSIRSPRV